MRSLCPLGLATPILLCLADGPAVAEVAATGGAAPLALASAPTWPGHAPPSGVPLVSEKRQEDEGDGVKLVLGFEARSNRLTSSDSVGLDRLAAALESQPNNHLVVLVPFSGDLATRHFMASRLAVVEQELSKRGIAGDTVKIPRSKGNDIAIVLCIAPRALPRTPLEMLPIAAEAPPQASDVREQDKNGPIGLLPGHDAEKDAPPVANADVIPTPTPDNDPRTGIPSNNESDRVPATLTPDVVGIEELWVAALGQSLRTVLKDWGTRAGWTIVWQSDREYPIDAPATFSGDFTSAASQLFNGFATAVPAPSAHFYKGNRVLLVESGEGR